MSEAVELRATLARVVDEWQTVAALQGVPLGIPAVYATSLVNDLLASLTGEGEPVAWRARNYTEEAWTLLSDRGHLHPYRRVEALYTRPVACPDREAVARVLFERGRTVHDAESWEACGDEMREWLLGHADAILELLFRGWGIQHSRPKSVLTLSPSRLTLHRES